MLVESTKIRNLLNTSIDVRRNNAIGDDGKRWEEPKHYAVPLNPMPGLTILLLGIMMSGHHQNSMVSTMIHKQWGTMFVGFAMARAVTYIMLYIKPPQSYLPSRPPSELITSFCLTAGGIIFMISNKDTVAALEAYGLDAMFTFIVTIGVTGVLMAWAVVVCAIKGWAARRETPSSFTSSRHSSDHLHAAVHASFINQHTSGAMA
jgi:hypothetical protein